MKKTNTLSIWIDPINTPDHFGVGFGNGHPHIRPVYQLAHYMLLLERLDRTEHYIFRPFCGTTKGMPTFGITCARKL